jgi:hypothetical protein
VDIRPCVIDEDGNNFKIESAYYDFNGV